MNSHKRREFLKLCVASLPGLIFPHGADADAHPPRKDTLPAYRKPGSVDRYIDALPVPKRLAPEKTGAGQGQNRIRMLEFTRQMHSQLPPTRLWGFEGQYPGPTIEAIRGTPTAVQWENNLPLRPIFD